MTEAEFVRHIELLELLTDAFSHNFRGLLSELATASPAPVHAEAATRHGPQPQSTIDHPKILAAIRYVAEHLCEPGLTVERISHVLEINPTYLSRVFAEQTGMRLSRYIADHRIRRAQHLLATTHWQIKRIALLTGHANPNWFSHVFQVHTGMAPTDYRLACLRGSGLSDSKDHPGHPAQD